MTESRPDPDALLAAVQQEQPTGRTGALKIFFGAAPGVGKTYAMLEAARKEGKSGIDIVVGYVEPHVRPETQSLILGLEILPQRVIDHRGSNLHEFDLEAALARKPHLIVVDELAHTNAPGLTHAKRWQDVQSLLDAGIDVYTTLNVQHLESLNDVVAKITGVVVRETVPDAIFDAAHEVELVDLPPEDLIERLKEGKIYVPHQAARAIENFFRKGNLLALRELALRRTADRVNVQVESYRKARGDIPTWATSERLLVCVGPSPLSARLVRSTFRMAAGLKCPWIAAHVETPTAPLNPTGRQQLFDNLQLAEQLGGKIATLTGNDPVGDIVAFARANNVTKIIVGKPLRSNWSEWFTGSFVYSLIRCCGDIDVYVITGEAETATKSTRPASSAPGRRIGYGFAVLVVAVCTGISYPLSQTVTPVNLAMIYLIGVVAVSLLFGRGPSAMAAILGVAAFDFFFVPPYQTFAVEDTQYLFTFAVMLATGLIISTLMGRVRDQVESARRRERRISAQYALSRELAAARTTPQIAAAIERAAIEAFEAAATLHLDESKATNRTEGHGFHSSDPVAQWVFEHGQMAGISTPTLPGSDALYLPVVGSEHTVGVLRLAPKSPAHFDDPRQLHLAEAFVGQAAVAIERLQLVADAERIEIDMETERLRNALLSSVSHDLRTPLAAISGASSTLLESETTLDKQTSTELLRTIVDESAALNRLVGNLLDATRIESGAIAVHREWQSIEELVGAAIARIERRLAKHKLRVDIPADLPLVHADGALIQQVLVNLLENAAKYCPAGTEIAIEARTIAGINSMETSEQALRSRVAANREANSLPVNSQSVIRNPQSAILLSVSDRGPGMRAGMEKTIFEKFQRGAETADRDGFGLGLSICRGIVLLHGGRIWAENRPGGGAAFHFTLPLDKPASQETI